MGKFAIKKIWARFWMLFASMSPVGRLATRLASLFAPPYYGRQDFAWWNRKGYVSPKAEICHERLTLGSNVFIDDRVLIYHLKDGGPVEVGDRVHLYRDTIIQTGQGGSVSIGAHSFIQPRCTFSAFKGPIRIAEGVQIAPNCSFYSYDHGIAAGVNIIEQPLQTKGGIVIESGAWLGVGVTVLDGVTIGKGAVVGAGSVVMKDVPKGAVVMGVPACIVKLRDL
jgi:acetyltransferase-like isoleucine patch superfamily enzyme